MKTGNLVGPGSSPCTGPLLRQVRLGKKVILSPIFQSKDDSDSREKSKIDSWPYDKKFCLTLTQSVTNINIKKLNINFD